MKAVVLAAGYATRLYPLTKNFPKPLLEVNGRTILDYIVDKVNEVDLIDQVIIVTNDCFYEHFLRWSEHGKYEKPIKILNDHTISNETRLGAIADIQFCIEQVMINDDLLVVAGDNLFDFHLTTMVEWFLTIGTDIITAHTQSNVEELKRTGVVQIDNRCKVIGFEEKPTKPLSNLAVPPFYIFTKNTVHGLIKKYIDEGNSVDAPGSFIPWLIKYKEVYVHLLEGKRYDIGTIESYHAVKSIFEKSMVSS